MPRALQCPKTMQQLITREVLMKLLTGMKYGDTKKITVLYYTNLNVLIDQIANANQRKIRVLVLVK